jgi:hypothetical protein
MATNIILSCNVLLFGDAQKTTQVARSLNLFGKPVLDSAPFTYTEKKMENMNVRLLFVNDTEDVHKLQGKCSEIGGLNLILFVLDKDYVDDNMVKAWASLIHRFSSQPMSEISALIAITNAMRSTVRPGLPENESLKYVKNRCGKGVFEIMLSEDSSGYHSGIMSMVKNSKEMWTFKELFPQSLESFDQTNAQNWNVSQFGECYRAMIRYVRRLIHQDA